MTDPYLPPSDPPADPPPPSGPPAGYPAGGYYAPPPPTPYGWAQGGYGAPPGSYGAPVGWQGGYGPPGAYGPPGRIRSTSVSIVLFICTLGIYTYVYNYKVHSEMKAHSGRGIGGGIALLLSFLANVAMPFVTPAEVGSLYARRGESEPVNGWTGLWVLLSVIGGYIVIFVGLLATLGVSDSNNNNGTQTLSTGSGIALALVILAFAVLVLGGLGTWFVKTNGALNRYWESVGVTP
jgi:Domain of unknown function (DUF4234)